MPFILICGIPSSGKTKRATELKEYFENDCTKTVNVISDDSIGVDRNIVYNDSKREKDVRGTLKSAVQRDLKKDSVTILDSLNYIKGCRYEFYCMTKECQTPQCVVLCDTAADVASAWNAARGEAEQYTAEIFAALVMRFEAPKSTNRWDSPLFVVQKDDILPFEAISDAIFRRKAPPPNLSTLPQSLSSTNFLYELDRTTSEVLGVIMAGQKSGVPGDTVAVPGATHRIQLTRTLTLAELQRHRRQFITYTKMHPVDDPGTLTNMFVQYLNNTLQ